MQFTKEEKLLYDFFVSVMKNKPDVAFPIAFLTAWQEEEAGLIEDGYTFSHPEKEELLRAWNYAGISVDLNKVIYEAIKTIKK